MGKLGRVHWVQVCHVTLTLHLSVWHVHLPRIHLGFIWDQGREDTMLITWQSNAMWRCHIKTPFQLLIPPHFIMETESGGEAPFCPQTYLEVMLTLSLSLTLRFLVGDNILFHS